MGVSIETDKRADLIVVGPGLYGLREPEAQSIYCGNSGTTMRLLSGVLSGQAFATKLMGDHSLSKRPMDRVLKPLRAMGAEFTAREERYAPLHIHGRRPLRAIAYESLVASAQVKSCVLLAGLYGDGVTSLQEPFRSRDHSERMMAAAGIKLDIQDCRVSVQGGQSLNAQEWVVPGDISSAAFFMVAALLAPGSELMLRHVGVNPTRDGVLEILRQMGGSVKLEDQRSVGGEPLTDILVKTSPLRGVSFGAEIMPRLVDEVPILAVAATQAEGITEIRGAGELRVKESDRLTHLSSELTKLGAQIEEFPDGLRIHGPTPLTGPVVDSFNDHRLVMCFAVAGLVAQGETRILNADSVDISYPTFWQEFEKLRVA
jgi:3-phosphoshikimate 1-carboxyvinyltransferase